MGGGSSGPQRLDPVIVNTNELNDININNYVKMPNIEKFKGGKIRLFKKNKSSFNYLFLFIYLIILLLFGSYLFYLSRLKK